MRPNAVECLRGLQAALASEIAPDVQSLFAQEALQGSQMMLEMLASEIDGAADALARDNESLSAILGRAAQAVRPLDERLAQEASTAARRAPTASLAISALAERNRELRALLERLLVACEDAAADGSAPPDLLAVRTEAYGHLREVSMRGWSFWDLFSFRERIAELRAGGG